MTNLVIKQGSNIEIVTAAIIQKLYLTASDINITNIELEGNLLSDHATMTAYNWLTGNDALGNKRFPDLLINVTGGVYIDFEDPVVELICASTWGDGVGLTVQLAQAVASIGSNIFLGNTNITKFNEFRYFTGVTTVPRFTNCSNLLEITIPSSIKIIENYAFLGCSSLTSIGDATNIEQVYGNSFSNSAVIFDPCNFEHLKNSSFDSFPLCRGHAVFDGTFTLLSVGRAAMTSCEVKGNFETGTFGSNTLCTLYVFPETTTRFDNKCFLYNRALTTLVIKATTPPTIDTTGDIFWNGRVPTNIYVPDASVSAYLTSWSTYSSAIKPISQWAGL